MNCQNCVHWNLKGSPLRADGFGMCKADKSQFAVGRSFSAANQCRLGKFVQAEAATVAARQRVLPDMHTNRQLLRISPLTCTEIGGK